MKYKFFAGLGLTVLAASHIANAQEQEVNLDAVEETKPTVQHSASKTTIMGRVDLTAEFLNTDTSPQSRESELKTYHMLVFLKANASEKVSFMGEIVNQTMYQVNYKAAKDTTVQFGRILVPFGNTQYYHHLYGGIMNYNGSEGVMFPNIWTRQGANLELGLGSTIIDTYVVNGVPLDTNKKPQLNSASDGKTQAGGLRLTTRAISGLTLIGSAYYQEWQPKKTLYILGFDFSTNYSLLKVVRMGGGVAQANIKKLEPNDIKKTGGYLELASNVIPGGEVRVRFGDYIDNNKVKTSKDTHNLSLGWAMPVDVLRVLMEYQWSYEAVNEIDNDFFRVMASLDF